MVIGGNRKWKETVSANWIRDRISAFIPIGSPIHRHHDSLPKPEPIMVTW
jgi:hypothetical protein